MSPAISAKMCRVPSVHCNVLMTYHVQRSELSSNVASAPRRWRGITSTAIRHSFRHQGTRCCDVPPRVDRRLDSLPGRSDDAGIMFPHEKLDLFRKAQWIRLLGIWIKPTDILTGLLEKPTAAPMRQNDWKVMRGLRVKSGLFIETCFAFLYAFVPHSRSPARSVRDIQEQLGENRAATDIHMEYAGIDPRYWPRGLGVHDDRNIRRQWPPGRQASHHRRGRRLDPRTSVHDRQRLT